MTNAALMRGFAKFLRALRYRLRTAKYLWVYEWRHGVQHAHLLLRADGADNLPTTRRALRDASDLGGLDYSVGPLRSAAGGANYVFKHTRHADRKAELPPADFRGRVYGASKGFLTKPVKALWRDVQEARPRPPERGERHDPRHA
jgi:hypothetical protein